MKFSFQVLKGIKIVAEVVGDREAVTHLDSGALLVRHENAQPHLLVSPHAWDTVRITEVLS